jgi:hypothetical protein
LSVQTVKLPCIPYRDKAYDSIIPIFDSMIGPGQLTWFVDGVVDFDHFSAFKNIKVVQQPINRFVYLMPRIQYANIKKHK